MNEALHSHTILRPDFERAAWDAGNVKDDTHCKNSKASRVEIEIFESIVVVVVDYLVWGYVCAVSCSCVSLLLMVLLLFDKKGIIYYRYMRHRQEERSKKVERSTYFLSVITW